MIDIKFLTDFQLVTFVLGITFSILSVAMVFYSLRHPDGFRNTFLKVLFIVVLPMITYTMWFACVFAAYEIFNSSELYIMLLSLACGIALGGLTTLIAWGIHRLYIRRQREYEEDVIIEEQPVEIKLIEAPKENNKNEK